MTSQISTIAEAGADVRGREWQAWGAAGDRRTATRMGWLTTLIATTLVIWSLVQFL